jgi:hypothetical protein
LGIPRLRAGRVGLGPQSINTLRITQDVERLTGVPCETDITILHVDIEFIQLQELVKPGLRLVFDLQGGFLLRAEVNEGNLLRTGDDVAFVVRTALVRLPVDVSDLPHHR